jgi:hypothetical protein
MEDVGIRYRHMVYFIDIWYMYFVVIWKFFLFWYNVTRKIWQQNFLRKF